MPESLSFSIGLRNLSDQDVQTKDPNKAKRKTS